MRFSTFLAALWTLGAILIFAAHFGFAWFAVVAVALIVLIALLGFREIRSRVPPLAVALIIAGLGLTMLPACSTAPVVPPSDQVTVAKAEYVFELAYNVSATAYLSQEATLPPATKATVKGILQSAYKAVVAAQTAETLGDATTMTSQAAAALSLASQAWSILQPGVAFPVTAAPASPVAPATAA